MSAALPTRLIILTPHLRGAGGHHLAVCTALVRAARRRGIETSVVVERGALTPELRAELGALDLLPPSPIPWELPGDAAQPDYRTARSQGEAFAADAGALDALIDDRPTLIVVDGLQPARFYGLAAWRSERHADTQIGVLHLAFTFNLFDRASGAPNSARHVYAALLSAVDRPHAQIAVFGGNYRRDFEALTGVRTALYPLPLDFAAIPRAQPGAQCALTLIVNVAAPECVDAVIECVGDRFVRRSFKSTLKLTGWGQISADHRRRLEATGVPLVERTAPRTLYEEMFRTEGIAVFAYPPNSYRRSSSGVMAEAAAAGLVTVVPAGTWLAESIDEGLAAGVAVKAMRGRELIRALKAVHDDWPRYVAQAARASEARRARAVDAFLDQAIEAFPAMLGDALFYGVAVGARVSFAGFDAAHHLFPGWSFAEPWGRWLEGERAALRLYAMAPDGATRPVRPRRLQLEAMGLAPHDAPQMVDVHCNGVPVGQCVFGFGEPPRKFDLDLPTAVQTPDIRVEFYVHRPVRPIDLGLNADVRRLGFGLIALSVSE